MSLAVANKPRKIKETDQERIARNKKEMFNNMVLIFINVKSTPMYKFWIQFLFSLAWTLLFTSFHISEQLLSPFLGKDTILYNTTVGIAFTLPQLALFYLLFKSHIFIYFKKLTKKQVSLSIKVGCISLALASLIGLFFINILNINLSPNAGLTDFSFNDTFTLLFSLLGEEILFFSTFFLVLSFFAKQSTVKHYVSFAISGLLACLIFGLAHLWTYDFNIIQCLIVIGLPSMMHVVLYVKTKNIFATYTSHIVYDAIVVLMVVFASSQN